MKTKHVRHSHSISIISAAALILWAGLCFAQAKSAILFIGDGMGPIAVKASQIKLKGPGQKLAMLQCPVSGSISTRSANADVTDSAAAGTALATGHKTNNGMIAMAPDGTVLKTILETCRDAGKITGLVATSSITHATPASFGSHVQNRGQEFEIAGQLIENRVNVLFGGGLNYFLAPDGDAWIGIDLLDKDGEKVGNWAELLKSRTEQQAERTFLTPPDAVKARLWIWRGSGLMAVFDDIELKPKSGDYAGGLVNGNFEKGDLSGWNVWSGCEIVSDGGSSALMVSGGGGLEQLLEVEPGQEYSFEYRGRITDPDKGKKKSALPWDAAKKAKYRRIKTRDEMNRARGPFLLGLFQPGAMEMDPEEPTLAEMTAKALDLLGDSRKGFFMMVEGSQIDWAAHGNDAEELFRQMAYFDEAIEIGLERAKEQGDLLIVVTADHETGGISMKGSTPEKLELLFSTDGHTAADVPLFAYGPGSEAFAGPHDNTDVPKLIAKALGLEF